MEATIPVQKAAIRKNKIMATLLYDASNISQHYAVKILIFFTHWSPLMIFVAFIPVLENIFTLPHQWPQVATCIHNCHGTQYTIIQALATEILTIYGDNAPCGNYTYEPNDLQ